ncbi:MAG TPA: hypothetical protein VHC49_18845 [Mycobacteriales bacterium]|nr:hypothetical protein [Mycobacteriales bacterium]
MTSARTLAGVLIGCALVAGACSSSDEPPPDEPQPQPAPTVDAQQKKTEPPGIAPAQYRQQLATTGRPMSDALAGIRDAQTEAALSAHLGSAERAVGRSITALAAIQPPEAGRAEHADYVSALRTLDADLTEVQSAVSGKDLCAPSSVLSRLGALRSRSLVPAAAQALQQKGFATHLSLPAAPREQTRRLANGTFTRAGSRTGLGRLRIRNDGSTDAVVSLVTRRVPAFAVYVRSGASYTVTGIKDGTYVAYFTTGRDWDQAGNSFTRSCNFTRYDDDFPYVTTPTVRPGWTITLEEVINGNARTSDVDPKNYPSG